MLEPSQFWTLYDSEHDYGLVVDEQSEALKTVQGNESLFIEYFIVLGNPLIDGVQFTRYSIVITGLQVLIIEEVGEYIPFTCTINFLLKYPLKLVTLNSPVLMLKEQEVYVVDKFIFPVESQSEQDFKVQYVGLFYIDDNQDAVNTVYGVVNEPKFGQQLPMLI